jgi:transposase
MILSFTLSDLSCYKESIMNLNTLRVAIDVGSDRHHVAVGLPNGCVIDEFSIAHHDQGFTEFFHRVTALAHQHQLPVAVAMEGYNGWARPLDGQIITHGYDLYSVNNLKLARYKEVFPTPAKTDAIDARRILELFRLSDHLPLAKAALQQVLPTPITNDMLKRLTRRRRLLVDERVRIINRLQADLQAVCPELLMITQRVNNRWFLNFLTCREDLPKLARLHLSSLLTIPAIGPVYAKLIQTWQANAHFAPDVAWVGAMILQDARRILALGDEIAGLDMHIKAITLDSALALTIGSIPGFGDTCRAELAGEIGTMTRFESEASLAFYVGVAALDNSSGKKQGTRTPRHVNTRAKAAMMVAVARHISCVPSSKTYYDKKRAEGKKHNQAIRSLARHLVRVIWSMVKHDRLYEVRA